MNDRRIYTRLEIIKTLRDEVAYQSELKQKCDGCVPTKRLDALKVALSILQHFDREFTIKGVDVDNEFVTTWCEKRFFRSFILIEGDFFFNYDNTDTTEPKDK